MESKSNKADPPRLSDLAAGIKYESDPPHLPPINADCDGDLPPHVFLLPGLLRRRPYVPPAVEESGSFEHLALACNHLPTGMGNCHPGDVRS